MCSREDKDGENNRLTNTTSGLYNIPNEDLVGLLRAWPMVLERYVAKRYVDIGVIVESQPDGSVGLGPRQSQIQQLQWHP